jgi:hypothetical protein
MPEPVFVFADAERRTFVALNRAGDGYHFVSPAAADDIRVRDGHVEAGELVCTCPGGRFRGSCYVVEAVLDVLTPDFAAASA